MNTTSDTIVATIPVGTAPIQAAVTPDGSKVYVVNQGSNDVSVIDTGSNTAIATIRVGASPSGLAVTPDGSRVLISSLNARKVVVISTSSNKVTATWPVVLGSSAIAVSPDGLYAYIANQTNNRVSIHNALTGLLLNNPPGFSNPNSIAVAPNGGQFYVTNGAANTVAVYNVNTRKLITTVGVGVLPTSVAVSPDSSAAYVTNSGDGTLSVINAATNTVTASITIGQTPSSVAVSSVGSQGGNGGGGGFPPPVLPTLPQAFVNITYPTVTGQVIAVHAGDDLQAAINSATCGDALELDAGATFSGNYTMPALGCTGQVLIASSQIGSLPAGVQVQPSQAAYMPTIVTPNTESVLGFANSASGYYFAGINFTVAQGVQGLWNLITLSVNATSLTQLPQNIVFDRVLVHGNDQMCVRGFLADAVGFGLINSQVYGFYAVGQDTQAVLAYNSPGPYLIENNYLEATGENIMFGGADTTIANVVPSDATIRLNFLNKQYAAWNQQPAPCGGVGQQLCYDVKNTFEVKNGQRILFDSNVLSYNWGQGQSGEFLLITPRAQCVQSGTTWGDCSTPWAVGNDITITNNLFEHGGSVFGADGIDGDTPAGVITQSARVLISNNLATDINAATYLGDGYFGSSVANTVDWTIQHNTVANYPQYLLGMFFGDPSPSTNTGFTYIDNLIYGPLGANSDNPLMAYQDFPSGSNLSYDVFVGDTTTGYPAAAHFWGPSVPGNSCGYPSQTPSCASLNWALVGFVDFTGGSAGTDLPGLALTPTSPYHNAGSDGADIGANVPAVLADTANVVQ